MSGEIGIGVLMVAVVYFVIKDEIHEIGTWWKQEKKFNKKRKWS